MTGPSTLLSDLAERLPALSPQLRRAAHFVLEHPDDVAMHSLRAVAQRAGVAPPTLSRLARAADCGSYEDLRERCRAEIRRRGGGLSEKVAALQADAGGDGEGGAFLYRQAQASVANIEEAARLIDLEAVRTACERLAAARSVTLIAGLSAAPLAGYLRYMAQMALGDWRLAGDADDPVALDLTSRDERDAAVVLSFAPYAQRSLDLADLVSRQGVYTVAISDAATSPLAGPADIVLLTPTRGPQFFPSHVAAVMMIEALVGMMVRRGGEAAVERVRRIETLRRDLGEYHDAG